jgi:hypothetical protein
MLLGDYVLIVVLNVVLFEVDSVVIWMRASRCDYYNFLIERLR